ncbi:MAG TPA: DMT family transporter [Chitinophagaceae bacterium]|nr:DMT family transporter [Chitinophagaceae bacterium]
MKKALLQLHIAVLLWGFTGVLGKLISLDAPMLVWYRMLLTALFVLAILLWSGKWLRVPAAGVRSLSLIGGLMAAHWIAFYAAIKFSNASIALVCLSTSSVFTSLLEPLMNKTKYNVKELALGMLALAGMYLIYSFQQLYGLGILLGIIAALLSSVFTIYNKRIAHQYPVRTMVFYEMSTGFIIITALLPLLYYYVPETVFIPAQAGLADIMQGLPGSLMSLQNDWIWLIVLALCCTVWAQTLALNALKQLSSFTITLTVNMEPVYGILLAILIYREDKDLNAGFFAGMGLICLSVVLQTRALLLQNKRNSGLTTI